MWTEMNPITFASRPELHGVCRKREKKPGREKSLIYMCIVDVTGKQFN